MPVQFGTFTGGVRARAMRRLEPARKPVLRLEAGQGQDEGRKNGNLFGGQAGTSGAGLETKCSGSGFAMDFTLAELQSIPAILAFFAGPMLGMNPALSGSLAG